MAHFGIGFLSKVVLGMWGYGVAKSVASNMHGGTDLGPYSMSEAKEIMRVASTSPHFVEVMRSLQGFRGFSTAQTIEFITKMPASDFFDVFERPKPY